MASTYSKVGSLAAALLLALGALPACSTSSESGAASSSASPSAGAAASAAGGGKMDGSPKEEAPATSAQGTGTTSAQGDDTVVFEVTGTGTAMTIDLVPSGDQRLYDVPLPWSTTVTISPDEAQLQVVVVGSGENSPGCKITLNGEVVAEKPEGGNAHCIYDR